MPCITLLSDFGLQDASVAIARGVLMQHIPAASIVDITHDVKPFHTGQAAYLLGAAYGRFPAGTVHMLLFDLFSETVPRLMLCEHLGHYFLTPDNGLLPLALRTADIPAWQCFELTKNQTFTTWLDAAGKVAGTLLSGNPGHQGLPPATLKVIPDKSLPRLEGGAIACEVIHIDHYENVVINITRQQFAEWGGGRPFRLQFMAMEEITEISDNYHDVREGFKLCRFNSNDYLEICINRGKAASLFGLRLGGKHNDLKITFE